MKTLLSRSVLIQAGIIASVWAALVYYLRLQPSNLDLKISIASFVAIPAAVIAVAQLIITAHIQRAAYIKDYALRFRTDKELSESFHYLVYRFSNQMYQIFQSPPVKRGDTEAMALSKAQQGLSADLLFFDPKEAIGVAQERRLDNLLGFFDALGYDHARGLLDMRDIAGIFGYYIDHLIQRNVIQDYLKVVAEKWPDLRSFHQQYNAPIPFRYLGHLLREYVSFRRREKVTT